MLADGQYKNELQESRLRIFLRNVSYAMMAFVGVAMLAGILSVACKFIRNYGWMARAEMSFHDSWTHRERMALSALERDIRFDNSSLFASVKGDEGKGKIGEWDLALAKDRMMAHYGPMLEKTLRTGAKKGSFAETSMEKQDAEYARLFGSMAIVAARMGNWEAMRAFILHGCPVDAVSQVSSEDGEDALSSVLQSGCSQRKFKEAEWLLEHGAKVEPRRRYYDLLGVDWKTTEWLISHSLPIMDRAQVGDKPVWSFLMADFNLPLIKTMVEDGRLDVNSSYQGVSPLCMAAQASELSLMRYLLGQGADPNIGAPLDIVLKQLVKETTCCDGLLVAIRLLLLYGADPADVPSEMHPSLREKISEIYQSYGCNLKDLLGKRQKIRKQ